MKNFSTAAVVLALATGFVAIPSLAQTTPSGVTANPRCTFLPNAPDQHAVVRGDTLWGISGRFLQYPWCWPQVWDMNREQIRNPHWIYPGQVVYFDRANNRLSLNRPGAGGSGAGGIPDVRLSPQVRMEGIGRDAIPTIPNTVIEPFLSQPLIIEPTQLASSPRIMAAPEGRVALGKGDTAYVRGDLQGATSFQAFRPGKPLVDPITKAVIGYEAVYLGALKLTRAGVDDLQPHTFRILSAKEEMEVGDRLVAVGPTPIINYVPHPPQQAVDGNIVSVYGGVSQAGQNQIVSINRGRTNGIDVGTVLELSRLGVYVKDVTDPAKEQPVVKLPDERYGNLFIFRVFDNISYGLVMQVRDTVQVGDPARSPE